MSSYRIYIKQGTPLKMWKKVRGFNSKDAANKCWDYLKQERVNAQFRLQYGHKVIEELKQ
jgi:hypothetical protein